MKRFRHCWHLEFIAVKFISLYISRNKIYKETVVPFNNEHEVWVSPIHKMDLSRNMALDIWARLQSPSGDTRQARNVRVSVSRRAINLNTISVALYRNIMQKRRASNAHCSTRGMFMSSARRSLLASSLFSEGASRITQDIAVLYIFKGCCASDAGSYERKERKRWAPYIRTYVILYAASATLCVHVRKMLFI